MKAKYGWAISGSVLIGYQAGWWVGIGVYFLMLALLSEKSIASQKNDNEGYSQTVQNIFVIIGWLAGVILISGGLYLSYLAIAFGISLTDYGTRMSLVDSLSVFLRPYANIIWAVLIIVLIYAGAEKTYNTYKRGELNIEIIKKKTIDLWIEGWGNHKIVMIFYSILLFFVILGMISVYIFPK